MMKKIIISTLLLLLNTIALYSQDTNPLVVSFISGAKDMYVGESVSVRIEYNQPTDVKAIGKASLTMSFEGTDTNIPVEINENRISITSPQTIITESVVKGAHEVTFALKYDAIKGEDNTEVVSETTSMSFTAWEHARAEITGSTRSMVGVARNYQFKHLSGKEDGLSEVKWTVNGEEQSTHSVDFTYTPTQSDSNKDLEIIAYATCTVGENTPEKVEVDDFKVHVYEHPILEDPEQKEYDYFTDDLTKTLKLCVTPKGGCSEKSTSSVKQGWEFTWYKNNVVLETIESNKYTLPRFDDNEDVKYKVECHNWLDNVDMLIDNKIVEFTVHVYANPRINEDCLEQSGIMGEKMALRAKSKGGNRTGWTYEWITPNGEKVEGEIYELGELEKRPVESYQIDGYKLHYKNIHEDGTLWEENEVPITIKVYTQGSVEIDEWDKDVYYNIYPKIKVKEIGGIKGGWKHSWTYETSNGESGSLADFNGSTTCYKINPTDEVITITIIDNYTNKDIFGKEYKSGKQEYEIKQWPKVIFADNIATTVFRVAENGIFTVTANPSQGGYYEGANKVSKNRYSYYMDNCEPITNVSDNIVDFNNISADLPSSEYYDKSKKTLSLITTVYALGPNDEIWDKHEYANTVDVYRRPLAPNSVVFKGNGSSKTVIPLIQMDDTTLSNFSYLYIYGIGDKIIARGISDRYYVIDSTGINANDIWVSTEWLYNNECRIASPRRFISGEIDNKTELSILDSTTSNSRADDLTSINNVTAVNNKVIIYNTSGLLTDRLHRGLNIVRTSEGKTIKLMVK